LKEGILNVVDSRFGKEVVVIIVNKTAHVTRRNDDFSVENMLQELKDSMLVHSVYRSF
jgi:hypothetical protein